MESYRNLEKLKCKFVLETLFFKKFSLKNWKDYYKYPGKYLFIPNIRSFEKFPEAEKEIYSELASEKLLFSIYKLHRHIFLDVELPLEAIFDTVQFLEKGSFSSEIFCQKMHSVGYIRLLTKKILTREEISVKTIFPLKNESKKILKFQILTSYLKMIINLRMLSNESKKYLRISKIEEVLYDIWDELSDITDPNKTFIETLIVIIFSKLSVDKSLYTDHVKQIINFNKQITYHPDLNYDFEDILYCMNKLITIDDYRYFMTDEISLLFQAAVFARTSNEQIFALKCLWGLTFNENCRKIIQTEEYISLLRELSEKGLNKEAERISTNILFELESFRKIMNIKIRETTNFSYDIMISYHFSKKNIVMKIMDKLKKFNIKIWIFMKEMKTENISNQEYIEGN